jgi:3-oxoadipate enol-lactonase
MIGMWLAAGAPSRVESLGLVCTSAFMPPAGNWRARADQVMTHGMESVREQSIGRWFSQGFVRREPGLVGTFGDDLVRIDPAGYAGCCAAIAAMDLRGKLSAIRAPALVIAGTEDPATPPHHGATIAAGITGARLLIVRGASHLATVSHPAEVGVALASHIRAAKGRSS